MYKNTIFESFKILFIIIYNYDKTCILVLHIIQLYTMYNNTIIIQLCFPVGEGCFGRDCHGVLRWSLQGAAHQLTYLTS